MLKNVSDYLSLLSLIVANVYVLHTFILSIIRRKDYDEDRSTTRWELLKDYINNEEE
ncbi:MAG: hypothetical protein K6A70_11160 [Erysipelotrichaceae bacterium]|nr:hypothetical protein [Erysipelotrichaceae bacterium]